MSLINTAYAATTTTGTGAQAGAPSFMPLFVIIIVMVLFYVWMWRGQGKKNKVHQNLLSNLSNGDEVMTTGGIAGKVSQVEDHYVQLMIAKEVQITIQKGAISTVLPKGTIKTL